ncbi:hypothetical protein [Mangrovicoccus ximenensis]|uniref:hypothetical protein n=1 Tax=Mangrovicoccus ximenensis TaxID=1911570 RepID=UPI000D3B7D74|nr:hypothetical protein [Mangrovicoccus ximenensis]
MAGSVLVIPLLSILGSLVLWIMGAGPAIILVWFFVAGPLIGVGIAALMSSFGPGPDRKPRAENDRFSDH